MLPDAYSPDFIARFWAKVDKSGDCWLWTGAKHSAQFPYGEVAVNRRPRGAHRVSWELANGQIPPGMCVCHRCDTPACVRPEHLFLGSDADNALDKVKKGRAPLKVSAQDVLAIRARYAAGEMQIHLAVEYGLSKQMVYLIVNRKAWKHL